MKNNKRYIMRPLEGMVLITQEAKFVGMDLGIVTDYGRETLPASSACPLPYNIGDTVLFNNSCFKYIPKDTKDGNVQYLVREENILAIIEEEIEGEVSHQDTFLAVKFAIYCVNLAKR